jgi:alpha-galactosidase
VFTMQNSSSRSKTSSGGLTRRTFLESATAAGMGTASGLFPASSHSISRSVDIPGPLSLLRDPDLVTVYSGLESVFPLLRSGQHWRARSIDVEAFPIESELPIRLTAPQDALTHLHFRWTESVSPSLLCLGDAWERSYGDLAWRNLVPVRPMPWYFVIYNGSTIDGYGVKTGAKSLCFWQLDQEGVSLWLDVSNGGSSLMLGDRQLLVAKIVSCKGEPGENPLKAVQRLCKRMCETPRSSTGPVYGSNDWYYAYGDNSQEQILQDADLMASSRPDHGPKPFTVIDDGWANQAKFPDMTHLAAEIRKREVRPGIWLRPLLAPATADWSLLLPAARFGGRTNRASELVFDPTIPEALQTVSERITAIRSWGYELLKHDYSTYDLLGQWGYEMGARPTLPGWSFHDRSKTNAEVILDFYRAVRTAAGDSMLIIGCNTVGHLCAGIFDIQRAGDDTSGRVWERTRRMGVNTLAFRLPQHECFFTLDADCVPFTQAIPWEKTRQWLDLVARSETALFVSPARDATGPEQRKALAAAFAIATADGTSITPSDWSRDTTPESWHDEAGKTEMRYRWCAPAGAYPFAI